MFSLVALTACGSSDEGPGSVAGESLTDPQLPPRGSQALPQWLAAGYYKTWHCESAPHPGRTPSPHGMARVCNNDALQAAAAGSGPLPVGAASVKEVYSGSDITVFTVSRKTVEGTTGDAWYWFEGKGSSVSTNEQGSENCIGCHGGAKRDFTFTIVP